MTNSLRLSWLESRVKVRSINGLKGALHYVIKLSRIQNDKPPKRYPPIKPPIPPSKVQASFLFLRVLDDPGIGSEVYTAPVPRVGKVRVRSSVRKVPVNVKTSENKSKGSEKVKR
jgi:hypothetical protein